MLRSEGPGWDPAAVGLSHRSGPSQPQRTKPYVKAESQASTGAVRRASSYPSAGSGLGALGPGPSRLPRPPNST